MYHEDNIWTKGESEISNLLSNKANASHTHNYAASIHTHDDRYYTESEVNNKLAAKAEAEHTHVWADITDKPTSFTPASHTHDDRYYTESEMNTKLAGKSDTSHTHSYAASSHTHDDRYFTESEINTALNNHFVVELKSVTVSGGSGSFLISDEFDCSKTNYTALGVVGYDLGGFFYKYTAFEIYTMRIEGTKLVLKYSLQDLDSSQMHTFNGKWISFQILYRKNY